MYKSKADNFKLFRDFQSYVIICSRSTIHIMTCTCTVGSYSYTINPKENCSDGCKDMWHDFRECTYQQWQHIMLNDIHYTDLQLHCRRIVDVNSDHLHSHKKQSPKFFSNAVKYIPLSWIWMYSTKCALSSVHLIIDYHSVNQSDDCRNKITCLSMPDDLSISLPSLLARILYTFLVLTPNITHMDHTKQTHWCIKSKARIKAHILGCSSPGMIKTLQQHESTLGLVAWEIPRLYKIRGK